MALTIKSRLDRWRKKTLVTPEGCWRFLGAHTESGGHGRVRWNGGHTTLTRVIAHLFHGLDLDSSQQALHKSKCKYQDCWNPDHLYVGTPRDNVRDSINVGTHHRWGKKY